MFSPSDFYDLFQPSYCERRVWLTANRPDLAITDADFIQLVQQKGIAAEEAHVQTIGPVETPEYPQLAFPAGFEETRKMIESETPIIYQGILIGRDNHWMAIPDLLIFDKKTERYIVRDVKLTKNPDSRPEIALGMGLCRVLAEEVLGYEPVLEVVTGDGKLLSPYIAPDRKVITQGIKLVTELKSLAEEPFEISGWSKCKNCSFFDHCWGEAWESRHVCTMPGIEQGISSALWNNDIRTWETLLEKGCDIAEITFERGSQTQRIGPIRASKILRQAHCLSNNTYKQITSLTLPNGYSPGARPIVIFDVENNMPIFEELGLRVDVYLWGLLVVTAKGLKQELIVSPPSSKGDARGWHTFLSTMSKIFDRYGDIPVIHFSAHEKTKVSSYISRFGDTNSTGQRVLSNLWDLYRAIVNSVTLPVASYSLKQIEGFVGFKRSQEQYGGSWSIARYNNYLEATTKDEADIILNEIKTYNGEDLMSVYEVYKWIEKHCC
jgi:predicted RecB family nuclease